jgi:hypothetical protein
MRLLWFSNRGDQTMLKKTNILYYYTNTYTSVLLYYCMNNLLYCIVNKGLDSLAPERKHDLWPYSLPILLPILHTALTHQHIPRPATLYMRALTQVYGIICSNFNPILHTAWLDNHALTLKINSAKFNFYEKSRFLHTSLKFCCESRKI